MKELGKQNHPNSVALNHKLHVEAGAFRASKVLNEAMGQEGINGRYVDGTFQFETLFHLEVLVQRRQPVIKVSQISVFKVPVCQIYLRIVRKSIIELAIPRVSVLGDFVRSLFKHSLYLPYHGSTTAPVEGRHAVVLE